MTYALEFFCSCFLKACIILPNCYLYLVKIPLIKCQLYTKFLEKLLINLNIANVGTNTTVLIFLMRNIISFCFLFRMQDILQSGLLTKWRQMWKRRINFCAGSHKPQPKAVSILDIQGGLYLLAIGVASSLVLLAAEVIQSKRVKVKRVMDVTLSQDGSKKQTTNHDATLVLN